MIEIAIKAALKAGEILRRSRPTRVSHKGAVDLVTEIDLASEEAIKNTINEMAPGTKILAEEAGGEKSGTMWVVDPLDGTTNFIHGFPAYSVSIAWMEDHKVKAGCVYDVPRNLLYTANLGGGAFCNNVKIQVSQVPDLDNALLQTGFPYDRRERADYYLGFFKAFLVRTQGIRRTGSAALDLCHLAAGYADGFWEFGLKPWDVCAGSLLITEAGGKVTSINGEPFDLFAQSILASNGLIHKEMLDVISLLRS